MKLKIYKYLTTNETHRWVDQLQNLTESYNNANHRSIGMSPQKAQVMDQYKLWKKQYDSSSDNISKSENSKSKKETYQRPRYKFKIGDRVKISFLKDNFDREYSQKWSTEIFTVTDRKINQNIPMYSLKDYNNDEIESFFYEYELQLAFLDQEVVYKIEKILKKRKRKGQSEVLVKWKGWSSKFNSWIPENQLKEL